MCGRKGGSRTKKEDDTLYNKAEEEKKVKAFPFSFPFLCFLICSVVSKENERNHDDVRYIYCG